MSSVKLEDSTTSDSPKVRTRSGAFVYLPDEAVCAMCAETHLALLASQEQNESLMRGFSRIISHLNKASELVKSLEENCRQKETAPDHIHVPTEDIYIIDPDEIAAKRKEHIQMGNMADQMYPKGLELSDIEEHLTRLEEYLRKTREICISSANSCFEVSTASISRRGARPPLKRINTLHGTSFGQYDESFPSENSHQQQELSENSYRPPIIHCRSEHTHQSSLLGSLRRTHSETELNTSLPYTLSLGPLEKSYKIGAENARVSYPSTTSINRYDRGLSTPAGGEAADQVPFRSHLLSVLQKQHTFESLRSISGSTIFSTLRSPSATENEASESFAFVKPLGKGLTGNESQQLLEKITILEEERLTWITKNEELNDQNKALWKTISEMGHDLDRKHLQLQLLKTDIRQATTQLRLAAEMRDELRDLKRERDWLKDKSNSLEDESKLVKESIVHRLTEMGATNKVLVLDNHRLRNKIVQLRSASAPAASSYQSNVQEFKSIEIVTPDHEDFRRGSQDLALQEALLELNDGNTYVHKQGFLVKQGHKVKNWRRRMFVLDTQCLSYYKTEEPLGTLPLEEIIKVQVTQGQTTKPNMFEVHRQESSQKKDIRVYYLSAPTSEEMQSWMGIIQTLKDTKDQTNKALFEHSPPHSSTPSGVTLQQPQPPVVYNPLVKNRSHTSTHVSRASNVTMPRTEWENSSRLRVTEQPTSGVRNRMFTEGGQRRQDLLLHIAMDTSDEEEIDRDIRSPFSNISSDEEVLRNE